MELDRNWIFYENGATSTASEPNIYNNSVNCDMMAISIHGTATTVSIAVEGRIDLDSPTWSIIKVFNPTTAKMEDTMVGNGCWNVGISGFQQIRTKVVSIAGGTAHVFGRALREV